MSLSQSFGVLLGYEPDFRGKSPVAPSTTSFSAKLAEDYGRIGFCLVGAGKAVSEAARFQKGDWTVDVTVRETKISWDFRIGANRATTACARFRVESPGAEQDAVEMLIPLGLSPPSKQELRETRKGSVTLHRWQVGDLREGDLSWSIALLGPDDLRSGEGKLEDLKSLIEEARNDPELCDRLTGLLDQASGDEEAGP